MPTITSTPTKKTTKKVSIAILGFGKEGQALARYFVTTEITDIVVLDQKLDNLPKEFENLKLQKDLNIPKVTTAYKSPGIALNKIINEHKVEISSLITMLFQKLDMNKVIAVTGTKGKSTTASLIQHVLVDNNYKSQLLGNIGSINTDLLDNFDPESYYVFELSSFQCQMLRNSPHIAIWTNFFVDHQDVHSSMEEYYNAKANITKFQASEDYLIKSTQIPDNIDTIAQIINAVPKVKFATKLQGDHNQINCQLVMEACLRLGLSKDKILKSIESYEPLKGRIEMVGMHKDIKFYADDLATIPEATWAAIQSFGNKNLDTIIVGGYDKGIDYTELANNLTKTKIKNFICFEPTGSKIVAELDRSKCNIMTARDMKKAVELAYKLTTKGGICLMSTASASFGMFANAYDRGEQYRNNVKELGEREKPTKN